MIKKHLFAKKLKKIQKKLKKVEKNPVFIKDWKYDENTTVSIRSDFQISHGDQERMMNIIEKTLYDSGISLKDATLEIVRSVFANSKTVSIKEVPEGIIVIVIDDIIMAEQIGKPFLLPL